MWWKLVGLGLIETAVVLVLFVPIKTHAVRYDTAEAARGHIIEIFGQSAVAIGGLVLMVAALVIPIWLAFRIVRRPKNSN